jgi:23S rRNA (guanine745-N1)-methyltransferase
VLAAALPFLRCPHCGAALALVDRAVRCETGHSFDVARQGYVDLMPAGTRPAGDTAEMVAAREAFLGAGHYAAVAEAVAQEVAVGRGGPRGGEGDPGGREEGAPGSREERVPGGREEGAPVGGGQCDPGGREERVPGGREEGAPVGGGQCDPGGREEGAPVGGGEGDPVGREERAPVGGGGPAGGEDGGPRGGGEGGPGGREEGAAGGREEGAPVGGGLGAGGGCLVEIGAGTGYYLARAAGGRVGIALDSSRYALRRAARAGLAAVGCDAWRALPVRDGVAAAVLCVFAPRNADELRRILAPDGVLIVVTPTPRHLHELVQDLGLVTVDERKPERLARALGEPIRGRTVERRLELGREDVRALIAMGPSARHVDADAVARAAATTLSVRVAVYGR